MHQTRTTFGKFLHWSGTYLKADMVYLTKNGFWISFGQIMNTLLSLGLLVAFANLLPKEIYGTYRYILSLAGILNIFTLSGMGNAVARAVARGEEGAFRASVRFQLKWNILMFGAFLFLGGYYFFNGDTTFGYSFLILGLFVPATFAFQVFGAFLEGKKEFRFASISSITSTFVYCIGMFTAIFFSGEILWLVFAYAATTFFAALFFYSYTLRRFRPDFAGNATETIRYGRRLSYINVLSSIISQIDKIILTQFWGPAQLAIYVLARAVPDQAVSFLKNWLGIGFPKFAEKTADEINKVFYRRIFQGMIGGAFIALAYVLVAPYLFIYLLPQYIDGIVYSQILALGFIFAMPNRYISLLCESQRLTRVIFLRAVITGVITLALYVVFGTWGGILGLVTAVVAKGFLGMIINITAWRIATK